MNIELASLNYFIFWSKNQLNHDCSDECKTRLALVLMIVQPMIISLSCHRWKRKEMALRHALIFPTHDWWHCQVSRAAWPCHPATQSQWSWLYGSVLCRGRPGCSGLQVKQSRVAKFRPGPWMHGIKLCPFLSVMWLPFETKKIYIHL